jgi:hypothetical protein
MINDYRAFQRHAPQNKPRTEICVAGVERRSDTGEMKETRIVGTMHKRPIGAEKGF